MKNIKPIFFIGNGPSLNDVDLGRLKGVDTFSFNRAYIAYDEWGWYPTYYMMLDTTLTDHLVSDINDLIKKSSIKKFFLNESSNIKDIIQDERVHFIQNTFKKDTFYNGENIDKKFIPIKMVPNSPYCALELVYKMGYTHVYLIGCDAKYTTIIPDSEVRGVNVYSHADSDPNHFRKDYLGKDMVYGTISKYGYYDIWKNTSDWLNNIDGLKIISCTNNSSLNEFLEYRDFEKTIGKIQNNDFKIFKNTNALDSCIKDMNIVSEQNSADLMIVGAKKIDTNNIKNLKAVFRVGVGDENIPYDLFKKNNIKVFFPSEKTKEILYKETANFTCGLIFYMWYRGTHDIKKWEKQKRPFLNNANLLVVGNGNIGNIVSNSMKQFMNVDVFDIKKDKIDLLPEKIKKSDIITIHISAQNNEGFWDEQKIEYMKHNSILINTSRGSVINEDDLYSAVKNEKIYVACDVFWEEPYSGKLMEFYPNRFYASPHVASNCVEFIKSCSNDLRRIIYDI